MGIDGVFGDNKSFTEVARWNQNTVSIPEDQGASVSPDR